MLTSIKQRVAREEEEGFTLIELMVVLLIIAILLAIAIPTFLGTRNTANARATQSDLNNALTAEQTYWTQNQSFSGGSDLSAVEPSLGWETAATDVTPGSNNVITYLANESSATPYSYSPTTPTATTAGGSTFDTLLIGAQGKDGHWYWIATSDNSTTSFTAYYEATAGSSTMPALPAAAPGAGSASGSTSGTSNIGSWQSSF